MSTVHCHNVLLVLEQETTGAMFETSIAEQNDGFIVMFSVL
jgi:hypothetical protein